MKKLLSLLFLLVPFFCWSSGWNAEGHVSFVPPCIPGPHYVETVDDGPPLPTGSLRYFVQNACPGDTIYFDVGTNNDTIKLHNQINIYKNLVIIGNGNAGVTVISGRNRVRLFQVFGGAKVEFHNMEMIHGRVAIRGPAQGRGAAILVDGQSPGASDSENRNLGRAKVSIFDCSIHHMAAPGADGGAVFSGANLQIYNSSFWACRARRGGAVFHTNQGCLDIDLSRFVRCFAQGRDADGGAIHIGPPTSRSPESEADISRMIVPPATLDDVTIRACIAFDDGGGIYNRADICINSSTFVDNVAGYGCEADRAGLSGETRINTPGSSAGGAIYSAFCAAMKVDSSHFFGNKAYGNGGAIYVAGDGMVPYCVKRKRITYSVFRRDSSLFCLLPGASGDVDRSGNTIGGGGAIYAGYHNRLRIDHCLFDLNYSHEDGGAVMMSKPYGSIGRNWGAVTGDISRGAGFVAGLDIFHSRFFRNRAISEGGGLFAGRYLRTDSCVFQRNYAFSGGGIMINSFVPSDGGPDYPASDLSSRQLNGGQQEAYLNRVVFRGNHAEYHGGGMKNMGSRVRAREVRFLGNVACQYGGGYYQAATCPISTTNFKLARFDQDTAHNGGAIYNSVFSYIALDSSSISRCLAHHVHSCGNGDRRTSAEHIGGGILNSGYLVLNRSTISRCKAFQGGALFNTADLAVIICRAPRPPQLLRMGRNTVLIGNSTISGNHAVEGGGGIYNQGDRMGIAHSTVARNHSGTLGGGLFNDNSYGFCDSVKIYSSIIASNWAYGPAKDIYDTQTCQPPTGGLGRTIVGDSRIISTGFNLVRDTTGSGWIYAAGDTLGNASNPANPLIAPLEFNGGVNRTHRILCGSPAFDAGDGTGPDQRGYPLLGTRDIGAFESQVELIDEDGDSYCTESEDPNEEVDCEDDNPDVNPGAEEICGNQVDEDCDGELLLIDPETGICCALGDNSQYYIGMVASLIDGIYNIDGPSPNGYWDYSYIYFGNPYLPYLYLQFSPAGPFSLKHWLAWVDWDNSGTFEPGEKIVDYCTSISFAQFVIIPAYASTGPHTMRVVMIADEEGNGCADDPYDPNACGEVGAGEVEDYTVCKGFGCNGQTIAPPTTFDRPVPGFETGIPGSEQIIAYPNPFGDKIYIHVPDNSGQYDVLQLMDAQGRILKDVDISELPAYGTFELETSDWSTGMYFVRLIGAGKTVSKLILKQ